MHRTRFIVSSLLAALLTSQLAARAADDKALTDPVVAKLHDRISRFLDGVSKGEEGAAFGELLAGSQLLEQAQAAAVRGLVEKSKEIADRYGAYREHEQVGAKRIGKDLVLLKYLYKCEKFPVAWHFVYYRELNRTGAAAVEDHWVVISVRFDTQVELLGY